MATDVVVPKQMVMADLKGKVDPDWCPGCGDFGVLAAVQKALVELQIPQARGRARSAASAARRTFRASSTRMACTRCMAGRCLWPAA